MRVGSMRYFQALERPQQPAGMLSAVSETGRESEKRTPVFNS